MRRLFLFLVLVLFGSLFVGEALAADLSVRNINGTQFTLLSNTDQCLVDCEAWIEWDLTKGIAADVQIPSSETSQFKFELIKENPSTRALDSFGIEVWEEKARVVTDYRIDETPFDFAKSEFLLGQLVCSDIGCANKDKDFCACIEKEQVEIGSHLEYYWEKVSDTFYGFKALKGKVYRLRIWGKKKASLEKNAIDWVPTFFGEKISEWSWWDSDWSCRITATINSAGVISADVTKNMAIPIDLNSDFTAFWAGVLSNGDDVRFVSGDDITELDFHFEGSFDFASNQATAWVEIITPFESASDSIFYLYFCNASAANGEDEFGTYDANYSVVYHMSDNNNTGQHNSTGDANNLIHGNTPTPNMVGEIEQSIRYEKAGGGSGEFSSSAPTMRGVGILTQWSASYWLMKTDGWDSDSGVARETQWSVLNNANDGFTRTGWLDFAGHEGQMSFRVTTNGGTLAILFTNKADWDANAWYHIVEVWNGEDSTMQFYVDGGTTDVNSISGTGQTTYDTSASVSSFNISMLSSSTEPADQLVDEFKLFFGTALTADEALLIYTAEKNALVSFGEGSISETNLSITKLNGLSFKIHRTFAFGIDGNVTVDFNVSQANNGRLLLDLNLSKNDSEGTGIVILKDLNLISDFCPDQNFVSVSECSVSIDYSGVPDGNYMVNMRVGFGGINDFNSSDGNFEIANDVNLLVKIPIDEETFELIDLNIYAFRVSYSDGNNFFTFPDLNAPIFISFPIGETVLTFEIDENTSDYFKRAYSLKFSVATSSATLQPYLVKKTTAGGGGIQSVLFTRTENNKAVPDIEIRAFRVVPNTGKTLMEQLITDSAGSATFAFVQGAEYTLDFLRDGNVFSSDLILRPVFTSYQFYLSAEIFNVPDENAVIFDVNYSPSLDYIDSNSVADINICIVVRNADIFDLNILIYIDDNTLFNSIVFIDGCYNLDPVSLIDAPLNGILNVEVILTTTDGLVISRSKAYSYNLSVQQRGLNTFLEELPGLLNFNRNSEHLEISTLGFLLLTLFIVGAISRKSRLDTGGTALFAMLLLGVFTYMGFVYLPAFFVAVIICFALIIFTRAF